MLARSLSFPLPPSRIASVLAAILFSTLACQSPPPRSPPRSPLSAPPPRISLPASFAHLLHACSSLARWLPCSLPPRSLPRSVLDRFFYACSLASSLARSTFAPLLASTLHNRFLARSPPRSLQHSSLARLLAPSLPPCSLPRWLSRSLPPGSLPCWPQTLLYLSLPFTPPHRDPPAPQLSHTRQCLEQGTGQWLPQPYRISLV